MFKACISNKIHKGTLHVVKNYEKGLTLAYCSLFNILSDSATFILLHDGWKGAHYFFETL